MSQDMPWKNKGDTRRQQPTQDCWHGSQGRGQDSMAHADLRPPSSSPFPHGLWQAAREPLGPVRGGQPSDNSPPAWPLPCLTPCRRQSPHSKQPHGRCRHTAQSGRRTNRQTRMMHTQIDRKLDGGTVSHTVTCIRASGESFKSGWLLSNNNCVFVSEHLTSFRFLDNWTDAITK